MFLTHPTFYFTYGSLWFLYYSYYLCWVSPPSVTWRGVGGVQDSLLTIVKCVCDSFWVGVYVNIIVDFSFSFQMGANRSWNEVYALRLVDKQGLDSLQWRKSLSMFILMHSMGIIQTIKLKVAIQVNKYGNSEIGLWNTSNVFLILSIKLVERVAYCCYCPEIFFMVPAISLPVIIYS